MLRSFISRRQRGDIDEREVRQQTPMGSRSGLGSAVDKRTRFRAASGTARLYIRSRALFAMSRHRQEWGDSTRNGESFRTLRLRYPVADLQRPLLEGIHPAMPRFQLTPGQVFDVMSYLRTLNP